MDNMSPTVFASEPKTPKKKIEMKSESPKAPTFSVIVHSGGKVRRRLGRNESSPYFIPISNFENKFYFNEPVDDNAIDVEDYRHRWVRQIPRPPSSASSSSGCSSIQEEPCQVPTIKCRCHSIHTSDYEEDDNSLRSDNASPVFPSYYPRRHVCHHRAMTHNNNSINTQGLIAIAMRTIKLIRRNQELQNRLSELQRETTHFIANVMNNPENQNLRNKITEKEDTN